MSPAEHKAFVQRLFDAFNTRDSAATAALFASDAVLNDVAVPHVAQGREQIAGVYARHFAAIPDSVIKVERMLAEDDSVVAEWTICGTHRGRFMGIPATHRPVTIAGVSIIRFQGGLLVADTRIWDLAGLLRQIGLLPSHRAEE